MMHVDCSCFSILIFKRKVYAYISHVMFSNCFLEFLLRQRMIFLAMNRKTKNFVQKQDALA